jgi:hypothetical protein
MEYLCDNKRHLICTPYSIENLHRMARLLDIPEHWYHKGNFPHYDIPKSRIKEITNKCTLISSKEIVTIIKNYQNENI